MADVACVLAEEQVNISNMRVFRKGKGREAVMVIHTDQKIPKTVVEKIENKNRNINSVLTLDVI